MQPKKTLVIGASTNPSRYSYKAIKMLLQYNHPVVAFGIRNEWIGDIEIQTNYPMLEGVDTVTLYLGADRQNLYYDYVVGLKPKRVIFNPGTENFKFQEILKQNGIEVVEHCTLIMLGYGEY